MAIMMEKDKKDYKFEYYKPPKNELTWREALLIYGIIIGGNVLIIIIIILSVKKW
jgi:hypothetical protein